ncbi:hypothetical protein [Chryseobacterium sp. IT-36CA2]|uniref:hypothetical protein n=1 Tax=Chryseobacterium sp. IT-36CA2 TaxID=3026460 RepID=UPI0039E1B77C
MEMSISEIIAYCGGSSIVISAIVGFLAQKVSDWGNEKWRLGTESKLKTLENKLSEKTSILNNLIDVQKSSYNFSQERRIKAIEDVWNLICEFNFKFPKSIITVYSIYTEQEIERLINSNKDSVNWDKISSGLSEINNEKFIEFYSELQRKISYNRPFLGEKLYYSFFAFTLFYSRLIFIAEVSLNRKELIYWNKDKTIIKLLKEHFSDDEYGLIFKNQLQSLNYTIGVLENKIIIEINNVLTGNTASKMSMEHLSEITTFINLRNITEEIT